MASVTSEIDEIRSQMAHIRRELHEDVREVVATAEAATDWHRYLRMYPWPFLGAAVAVGYAIVPKRRRSVPRDVVRKPDLEKVREVLEESSRDKMAEKARENTRKGLLAGAIGLIGPVVVRAAQGYAVRYLEHWIAQMQMEQMAAGPQPQPGPFPTSTGQARPGAGPARPSGPVGY